VLEVGDIVRSVGDAWSDKYLDKLFLVITFFETNEFGRKWIVLDHISGGTLIIYEDEVEKVAA
jgi:hypothetical protein